MPVDESVLVRELEASAVVAVAASVLLAVVVAVVELSLLYCVYVWFLLLLSSYC